MKTTSSFLYFCLVALISLLQVNCTGIKGNGNQSDHIINVSSYDNILITAGPLDFEYEQSDAEPYLCVTIDENLFEYLDISDNSGALTIRFKDDNIRKISLNPTVFKIKSNSKDLKTITFSGVGNFVADKYFCTNTLKLDISGVANIKFNDIDVEELACGVSGVGNIELTGKAGKASYNSSGVGNINAYECKTETADANVSGVGNIYLYSYSNLNINCSGMGEIKYKGEPANVNVSKTGLGSISAVD